MFIGSPAWMGILVLTVLLFFFADPSVRFMRADAGIALFIWTLLMWFAPKIATATDILLRPDLRREFGGTARFVANYWIELVYSILLVPVLWFGHTVFLIGLLFGREIGGSGKRVTTTQCHCLWPSVRCGRTRCSGSRHWLPWR